LVVFRDEGDASWSERQVERKREVPLAETGTSQWLKRKCRRSRKEHEGERREKKKNEQDAGGGRPSCPSP